MKSESHHPPPWWTGQVPVAASARSLQLARPFGLALLAASAFFVGFEIVERLWLTSLEPWRLHWLHLGRGVCSSLLAAGVVCWAILRNASQVLVPLSFPELLTRRPGRNDAERLEHSVRWFITMRWVATFVAASLTLVGIHLVEWLPREVEWPLLGGVMALGAGNLLFTFLLRRGHDRRRLLVLQGVGDLVLLTLLLHFSGGIENPLSLAMVFHVILGGILMSRRTCFWIAGAASGLFALMALGQFGGWLRHYHLAFHPAHAATVSPGFDPALYGPWVGLVVVVQGAVLGVAAYFVANLAERWRADERLLEAMADRARADQRLLEQALETTGTGLRVLTDTLQPHWANARWHSLFSIAQPPHDRPAAPAARPGPPDEAAGACLRDGQTRINERILPSSPLPAAAPPPHAAPRIVQITTAALRDENGAIERVVELAQDVTEQRQAQSQMMRASRLAAVGELAGRVAHEVNNPIGIISAKTRLMLADMRDQMSEPVRQELEKILGLTERVAQTARGLLSYCRRTPANRVQLDVRHPIREALSMIAPHAVKLGVAVQDALPPTPLPIEANMGEMEQVFLNLLLNALDAMPRGGTLRLSAEIQPRPAPRDPPRLVVSVADTGTGIAPALREQIFEPFFTTKPEGQGTGLGLSICQGLVRSHGGEITVDSDPGRGSRFAVQLPLADSPESPSDHG